MIIKAESLTMLLRGAAKNVGDAASLYDAGAGANQAKVLELLTDASAQLDQAYPAFNKLFPLPGHDTARVGLESAADGVRNLRDALDSYASFSFSPTASMRELSKDIGKFADQVDNRLFQPPPMLNDVGVGLKVDLPGIH